MQPSCRHSFTTPARTNAQTLFWALRSRIQTLVWQRGEQRPHYDGRRVACHRYHPELSGAAAPPANLPPSTPAIVVSLHPIGGFCAVSHTLPLPESIETEVKVVAADGSANGMCATFGKKIHCVAAEPDATFLRVGVTDGRDEVAFVTAVLQRLRRGYRVLLMRSLLGTRIELCYLFVRTSFGSIHNEWSTPRQLTMTSNQHRDEKVQLRDENTLLRDENAQLRQQLGLPSVPDQNGQPHLDSARD
jgi:hypothetical protein